MQINTTFYWSIG